MTNFSISRRNFLNQIKNVSLAAILVTFPSSLLAEEEQQTPKAGEVTWHSLDDGLLFARVPVLSEESKVIDFASIVKINPEKYEFKTHFDYNSKTIENWQELLKANVLVNASYWEPDYTPTNHLVSRGQPFIGQFPKSQESIWKEKERPYLGVFVADPADNTFENADVISLDESAIDYRKPSWKEIIESYPMLIFKDGSIKVKHNPKKIANRTVICKNRDKDISIITTEIGNLSLYETSAFLKDPKLGIKTALNLDGGIATEMLVDSNGFKYVNYGSSEKNPEWSIVNQNIKLEIPSVIGIYKK